MTLRHTMRSAIGLEDLRNGAHSLTMRADPLWSILPWMALMPGIFLSGLLLHRIPLCRLSDRRGNPLHLRVGSHYRIAAIGDDVVYGLGLFASWLFVFGLTVGRRVYVIVRTNYGLDISQFSSICTFSMLCSVLVSFVVYMMYLCITYLRQRSDPLPVRQAAKYEEIGQARRKHQKSADDIEGSTR